MTKAHSTAKTTKTQTTDKTLRAISQRHYTIGYVNVRHQDRKTLMTQNYSKHPALHLKGDWLSELGFTTGQPVTITTKKGS